MNFLNQSRLEVNLPALCSAANNDPAATFPIIECITAAILPAVTPATPNPILPMQTNMQAYHYRHKDIEKVTLATKITFTASMM